MKYALLIALALSPAAFAEDKPADPLPPAVKLQVAVAQRDFLIQKANYDEALKKMQAANLEAQNACDKAGKVFSADALACVDKPNASPAPTAPPPAK